jgi:hypothetical protein
MSKEDFVSGTVLEFTVPISLGYAYCKILDFRHIREFDGVLVKVFDHIVKEPIDDINILQEKDWLFGARRMPWLPGTRGKGAWKMKGILIAGDDNDIPDFKYSIKYNPLEEDKSKLGPWYVIRNLGESSKEPYPYECVKHLEDTLLSPRPAIETRTAMEYCRILNMDIKQYFDLSKAGNEITYKQMINIPIFKSIPKEIRGRALNNTPHST